MQGVKYSGTTKNNALKMLKSPCFSTFHLLCIRFYQNAKVQIKIPYLVKTLKTGFVCLTGMNSSNHWFVKII